MLEFEHNDVKYHPIKFNQKYKIMKLVHPGEYLSHYYFRPEESYDFSGEYLYKITGEGIELPNLGFRKVLTDFVEDCPEISSKIEDKYYRRNDLTQIINDYNNCITSNTTVKISKSDQQAKSSPQLLLINDIMKQLNSNHDKDLIDLLSDISNKLKQGEQIPSYMQGALKSELDKVTVARQGIEQLLKILAEK